MHQDSASEQEPEDSESEPEFVELDPTGRYGRVSSHNLQTHLTIFLGLISGNGVN